MVVVAASILGAREPPKLKSCLARAVSELTGALLSQPTAQRCTLHRDFRQQSVISHSPTLDGSAPPFLGQAEASDLVIATGP